MTGKQKKTNWQKWIGILIYFLIGGCCGILILEPLLAQDLSFGQYMLRLIPLLAAMYAAMFLQIIIHEAGHLVFGLLTGYRFRSFRVFSLMWIRDGERLRFRRFSLAGTGGQCLMGPPELRNGRMPVLLYNFGGAILNLISAALFFGLSFLCPPMSIPTAILRMLAVIGVAFALMNGLPLHMGPVENDGCNALALMRSPEATRAFWIQMKVMEEIACGARLRDMPKEWFVCPADDAMGTSLQATIGVLSCNRLMSEHRFEEADRQMAHLLALGTGMTGIHRALLIGDRVFAALLAGAGPEALAQLMTPEQRKLMKAMKTDPSVLRTEYALALLSDRDAAKAEKILAAFDRIARNHPYPQEVETERELMRLAEEKAQAASAPEGSGVSA